MVYIRHSEAVGPDLSSQRSETEWDPCDEHWFDSESLLSTSDKTVLSGGCDSTIAAVRHAGSTALDRLEPVLDKIREMPDLAERSRGIFYRRSKAFLHFHEDATGLYADVRQGDDFERYRVETAEERNALVALLRSVTG